ncbi:MAG: hypothetical protein J7449_04650 [Thermomicrobium sp.]|uniref:hypothetical protein n=1 Tax=Thermomicrobium sp. TaxID=1969469 RepID=UPI001B0BE997|nr:hypothetical protein [Thermomicrobium sp.]MBO9350748.1 hypothetical protein [Thermomicrobium sp.]
MAIPLLGRAGSLLVGQIVRRLVRDDEPGKAVERARSLVARSAPDDPHRSHGALRRRAGGGWSPSWYAESMVIGLVCSMLSILFGGRMVTAGLVRAPWLSRGEVLILAPVGSLVVRDDPLVWCWPDGGNLWLLAGSSTAFSVGMADFPRVWRGVRRFAVLRRP